MQNIDNKQEVEDQLESLEDRLERVKKDLRWQLSFQYLDWDYFLDTTNEAITLADRIFELTKESEK